MIPSTTFTDMKKDYNEFPLALKIGVIGMISMMLLSFWVGVIICIIALL